ncbi:MAG: translocation/assembly module TamB domain-containing protein [Ignavibacteria bacterium]|nr:translocation/assembly module TamB domain-containing protein [Ignavibacteria bacterium]
MQEEGTNKETKKKEKKKKSITGRLFKYFLIFLSSVFLLIVVIFLLLQTTFFKSLLLHIALNEVNRSLESKESYIYAETLEGNIFYNLKLTNVRAVVKGDTMIYLNSISFNHNIFTLLDQKVDASNLIVENPQINLTKVIDGKDTLWNIDYLLKPEVPKPEDTTEAEFDWVINAESVQINNLNFRMLAFKPQDIPIRQIIMNDVDTFDTDYLDVTDLNLEFDGYYSRDKKEIDLKRLAFNTNSQVDLENLSLKAELTENTLVRDFKMKTLRSNIEISNLFVEDFNIFNGFDFEIFQEKNLQLSLDANRFDFADLNFFIPDFDFVNSDYYLKANVSGNYKNFTVKELDLRADRTFLNLAGTVKGLDNPDNMYLDLKLHDSEIDPSEIMQKVPIAQIPDFRNVGKVYADATFTGEINRFDTVFDIKSGAGSVKGDAGLDFSGREIIYRANVNTRDINLAKITNDPGMKIILNSEINANGVGTDYRTMTAKVNYNLTNSVIFNQRISKSSGEIKINRSYLDVNIIYASNTATAGIKGNIDFRDMNNISYELTGMTKSLDISSLSAASEKSNLNFTFEIKGGGLSLAQLQSGKVPDLNKMTGKYLINIEESQVGQYIIPQAPLIAIITNDGKTKSLNLASRFVDIFFTGDFTYNDIPYILENNITRISEKITERLRLSTGDTLVNNFISTKKDSITQKTDIFADLEYKIIIKNLTPLYILTGDSNYSVTGEIKGKIKNKKNIFSFTSDGRFDNFRYQDSVLNISNSKISLNLVDYNISNDYKDIYTEMTFSSQRIGVGKNNFDSIFVYINTIDTINNFGIKGNLDSTARIKSDGKIVFLSNEYGFIFDTLLLGYKNYNFSNRDSLLVNFIPSIDSLTVNNIVFNNFALRDKEQRIRINGTYSLSSESDLNIRAARLNIDELFKLSYNSRNSEKLITGNIRRLNLHFKGTLDNPDVTTELNTDPLALGDFQIGRIDALVDYNDNTLKPEVGFFNPNNEGKLSLKGYVPFTNPFDGDTLNNRPEESINLELNAINYQTKIIEKFIPNISGLDAKLFSDLKITGKLSSPELVGDINIDRGKFKLDVTGVKYLFDIKLDASGHRLLMNNLKLNVPSDESRFISSTGYIDLTNLSLNDIDLTFFGDVKVLDKNVTYNTLGFYGDLIAGPGTPPIRLKGNQDEINLEGELLVKRGNIFIPGFQSDAYSLYSDNILYKIEFDTTGFENDSAKLSFKQIIDSLHLSGIYIEDPFDFYSKSKDDTTSVMQKKSSGKFHYNISIKSLDDIFTRFIIDEKTKQEFSGEVNINLFADNYTNNTMSIRGDIEVEDNSLYKFYKNFNAKGNVRFAGDVSNPILNIKANYIGTTTNIATQTTRDVEVILYVTGSVRELDLKWQVLVNDDPISGDPTDNAVSFILFGKLKDELNASQRASLFSNVGVNLGSAFLSSYLNQFVSSYLPFILSTDINFVETQSGSLAEGTDIRFTAALGDATIRFGGQILTDLSNTNFLIEYPLNKLLKFKSVSNKFILKFERIIDPYSSNTTTSTTNNRTGGALIYRIKF